MRKQQQRRPVNRSALSGPGSGGGIRTPDLWVMSPTSCRCSTPRRSGGPDQISSRVRRVGGGVRRTGQRGCWGPGAPAAASPPVGSPPQYSPALRWVTTGFGMGPGGASTLSATGAPGPPPVPGQELGGVPVVASSLCLVAGRAGRLPPRPRARPVGARRGHSSSASWPGPGGPGTPAAPLGRRWRTALGHQHGSAPVGCPPSTRRLSTRWSPGGLTHNRWGDSSWGGVPA